MTIHELIQDVCRKIPDETAVSIKRNGNLELITFGELDRAAREFSSGLVEIGVNKGDRVAIISENRPEWGISYLGILGAGCIAVPLDCQLSGPEQKAILDDSGAQLCVCSGKYGGFLPPGSTVSLDGNDNGSQTLGDVLALGRKALAEGRTPGRTAVDSGVACLIYTSGTTGSPKGVMLTHRNIVSNVKGLLKAISVRESDVFLSILPLYHTFECTAGFLTPLSGGARVHYASSMKSRDLLDDMKLISPTMMLGVPLIYEKLLAGILSGIKKAPFKKRILIKSLIACSSLVKTATGINGGRFFLRPLLKEMGLARLRFFVSGASALPEETVLGFQKLGILLLQGYGLSEASPVLCVSNADKPVADSVGPPLPGITIEIGEEDETGVGEILAMGENIMAGYFGKDRETREVLVEGWLKTGDLGWIDSSGNVHISGRKKNIIVSRAGKNIYPEEIESRLILSPLIEEVMVFGDKNPATGREEVHAEVFPNMEELGLLAKQGGFDLTVEKIEEMIKGEVKQLGSGLAEYKRIKKVFVRDREFPKTSSKKIKRFLVKKHGAGQV